MDRSAKFLMLQDLDLFSSLSHDELNNLASVCSLCNVNKDEKIFSKGDSIEYVYVLIKGSVKIGANIDFQKSIIKQLIHNGEIFGENILTKNTVRNDFAQSLAPSQIFKILKADFEKLITTNPVFCTKIVSHILQQLNNLELRIADFVYKKAQNRIENFIKKLALKKGIKIGIEEILIKHNLSHSDIAHITDTSRQTVSRVFGDLKKSQIIHFSPRKPNRILVRNLSMLG